MTFRFPPSKTSVNIHSSQSRTQTARIVNFDFGYKKHFLHTAATTPERWTKSKAKGTAGDGMELPISQQQRTAKRGGESKPDKIPFLSYFLSSRRLFVKEKQQRKATTTYTTESSN